MKSNNKLWVVMSGVAAIALLFGALLSAWMLPQGAAAQSRPDSGKTDTAAPATPIKPSQITVRGSGIVTAVPDTLVINIGVVMQDSTVAAAQTKAGAALDAMLAKLKAANIDAKDYRTIQYNVEPVMDYSGGAKGPEAANQPPQLVGFRVTNILEVTVHNAAQGPELIDSLVAAGANTIYNVSYTFGDRAAIEKQAYDGAMKDAADKAGRLAGLANQQLGRIVSISEAATGGAVPMPVDAKGGMGAGSAPIAPGQQTIGVDLVVTYEAQPGS
jgi:uncharacterized protein